MTKGEQKPSGDPLWADVPVDHPSDDQLGRASFAVTIAKTIRAMKGSESFVFGICGPWGCGKSSVLRMIARDLENAKSDSSPIVVNFNPWWFSGQDQILGSFLGQLAVVLGNPDTGGMLRGVGAKLSTLATVLRPFSLIPGARGLEALSDVLKTGSEAAKAAGESMSTDVFHVRSEIDEALRKTSRRIVVVMDDIDRLTAADIAQLFVIVKAVADFPNTVYLLSFDHEVVCEAIGNKLGLDGASYLEKIVQVHLDVPPASPVSLQQMFLQQLGTLLSTESVSERIRKDFANLFHDGIKTFFETPRSVKRLTNVLRVLLPAVEAEVYWPDFVGITAIQVFAPQVYRVIRDNKEHFIRIPSLSWRGEERAAERKFHEGWLNQVPEVQRDVLSDLVQRLFPHVQSALGNMSYGSDWESTWRADSRICSRDCIDRYFQFQIQAGAIGESEWQSFLDILSSSSEEVDRLIQQFCSEPGPHGFHSRAKEFLERTLTVGKKVASEEQAVALLGAILRNGDRLISVEDSDRSAIIPIDNQLRIMWAVLSLIERVTGREERDKVVEGLLTGTCGLQTLTWIVIALGRQHGRFKSEPNDPHHPRAISIECVDRLTIATLKRLRDAAADGSLANHPRTIFLARDWRLMGEEEAAKAWVIAAANDDERFIHILASAQTKSTTQSGGDHVATEFVAANADFLTDWFEGAGMRKRCLTLLSKEDSTLDPKQRAALQLVVASLTEDGKPISEFDRRRLELRAETDGDSQSET